MDEEAGTLLWEIEMTDDKKPGRGGKRPGAGRPAGTKKAPGRRIGLYLDPETWARLEERAAEERITPYAWLVRAVKERLEQRSPDP